MINVRIDSLFRFPFITEKNVKFYGKPISDFALFTFQKSHLTLLKFPVRACVFRFSLVKISNISYYALLAYCVSSNA